MTKFTIPASTGTVTIAAATYTGVLNSGFTVGTLTNNGSLVGANYGIENLDGSIGTLINAGNIHANLTGVFETFSSTGSSIGSLINQTGATIYGGVSGIYNTVSTIGMLTNDGLIEGLSAQGIGNRSVIGTLDNAGTIIGGSLGGVHNRGSIGTLSNSGSISWLNNSVPGAGLLGTISSVTNSGTIGGGANGITNAGSIGSLSNSGVISGTKFAINSTGAIQGTLTNTGSIEGNFVLAGQNLTIAGGTGGTVGTLSGGALTINGGSGSLTLTAGSEYLADSNAYSGGTTIDAGATLGVADQADLGSGAITFGGDGASLDLTGLIFTGAGSSSPDGLDVLTVTEGIGTTLQLAGDYTGETFLFSADGGTGTLITEEPACYGRGTGILTDRGDVAVEDLVLGDLLVTHGGALRAVKWIGRRHYAGRFVAGNRAVLPVRIKAGALAAGVPARDLMVSPQHAIYLNGMLFPAATLLNGNTITQTAQVAEVEYFHVELDRHDVILAEGTWAETFIDDGSRGVFHNAAEYRKMYPDEMRADVCYYAPRIEDGEELEAVRSQLADRAAGSAAA